MGIVMRISSFRPQPLLLATLTEYAAVHVTAGVYLYNVRCRRNTPLHVSLAPCLPLGILQVGSSAFLFKVAPMGPFTPSVILRRDRLQVPPPPSCPS